MRGLIGLKGYLRHLDVLSDVDLHFHRSFKKLDELRRDTGNVMHALVVKDGTKGRALDGLGRAGLAEEVVRDVGHLAEDRQVRGFLDLQLVRPGLA